jgi:hypothetical protein
LDEKDFKEHLRDLAHGHHHPEEHDWDTNTRKTSESVVTEPRQAPKKVLRKTNPESAPLAHNDSLAVRSAIGG